MFKFNRKRLLINDIFQKYESYLNKEIEICGWIETMRVQQQNGLGFISLNDGSTINSIQLILNPKTEEELSKLDDIYKKGTKGVSIKVKGKLIESPAEGQKFELQVIELDVYGEVNGAEYPIAKKKLTLDHIRKFPHLRIRTKTMAAIMRIRDSCAFATHKFYKENDFKYIHTPIITGNDCEGAGETFKLDNDFFKKEATLTVSGQLHGETYASGLSDIYTFGPTFRAENSHTTRHLAEFWMIEPEMCFIDFTQLQDVAELYLKYVIDYCLKNNLEDIEFLNKQYQETLLTDLNNMVSKPFQRMTYTEVIDFLLKEIENGRAIIRDKTIENRKFKKKAKGKHIFEEAVYWGCDLGSEHEKYMTDKVIEGPLIITDYPKNIKSFYMKANEDCLEDRETCQAMDLLVPNIGELIGGSMREDNYDILSKIMKEKNIEIDWYLDLRKYGTVPHGGFGLGFERLVMLMTGIYNIKDVIPYPRFPEHCEC